MTQMGHFFNKKAGFFSKAGFLGKGENNEELFH